MGDVTDWEYETHHIPTHAFFDHDSLTERLNTWGAQGYELVTVTWTPHGPVAFFKRPRSRD